MFSLRLLGGAVIEGPQGPLGGRASQRRRLALLCVLSQMRERPVSRDKLLALFWPESESVKARHSLADSLYQLRRELGESAILSTGEDLRLNPDVVTSDVAELEDALARGDAARAVALYHGPFLDGFFLGDAPEFERWVELERAHLARTYAEALEQLAGEAGARGDARAEVEWRRRLAASDPYNARVTRRLMEALAAAGDRAGALQQARIHATLLEQEFGAGADPEVEALSERLRSAPVAAPPQNVDSHDGDAEAPVSDPVSVEVEAEAKSAPPEDAPAPARAAVARTHLTRADRKLAGWRTAGLLGALLALVAVPAMVWRLPGTSARPGTATGPVAAIADAASPKAIAVLPCANLSRDPEQEYFSDGLTEELTSVLSQVRALRVAARTSAFAFKGKDQDIREIARTLNVGTVLECGVRRAGERVRVTAQLINAADGFHLWAETYEREGTDVFAIQSELAMHIASALEAELTPAERTRVIRRPTASPEAHALYLKGLHFWNQRTRSGYARAVDYYQRAIEVDSQYAAAYAGLAITYSLQGLSGELAPQEARERMRAAVAKALDVDDQSAEAYAARGAFLNVFEWNSEASERAYQRSLELNPGNGTARHLYANLLRTMGRLEEAVVQKRMAIELDPLAPQLSISLGYALLEAGRPDEAIEAFRTALELDATFAEAHAGVGAYYAATGRPEDALQAYRRAVELAGENPSFRAGLARALTLAGRRNEARALLGELQANAERTGIYSPAVAWVFLALDDVEGTLAWLQRSYQQRHPHLRLVGRHRDPRLADDPRYLDLRRRIGLPY
jgi:TolB-like protein/DNA-binding SARP family transcriptional activator